MVHLAPSQPDMSSKNNAVQQLGVDVHAFKIDIVLVCETWFTPKHADSLYHINNYVLHRKDRASRRGGGVCIYVPERYSSTVLLTNPAESDCNLEITWVTVVVNNVCFLITCIGHPPKPTYNSYYNFAKELLVILILSLSISLMK